MPLSASRWSSLRYIAPSRSGVTSVAPPVLRGGVFGSFWSVTQLRSCAVVMAPDCQVTLIVAPAASASLTVRTNDVHLSFCTSVWFGSAGSPSCLSLKKIRTICGASVMIFARRSAMFCSGTPVIAAYTC